MHGESVIIIGSGLGGLECAYILAKHGMKVTVLEQAAQIGGCLQTFRRKGSDGKAYVFDTGFHYIGGLGEGQPLNRLFKYFGLMDLPWQQLDPDCSDEVFFVGTSDKVSEIIPCGHSDSTPLPSDDSSETYKPHTVSERSAGNVTGIPIGYPIASGYENFVARLSEFFPEQRENLQKYADFLRRTGENIFNVFGSDEAFVSSGNGPGKSLSEDLSPDEPSGDSQTVRSGGQEVPENSDSGQAADLFSRSAYEFLNRTITDPLLRKVLSGNSLKMELDASSLPLYAFAQINNSFLQGAWRLGPAQSDSPCSEATRQPGPTRPIGFTARRTEASSQSAPNAPEGGAMIAARLANAIRSMGGEIRTRARVTAIHVGEDGRASGVEVCYGKQAEGSDTSRNTSQIGGQESPGPENAYSEKTSPADKPERQVSETLSADWIISDTHPAVTVRLIDKCKAVRKLYRERMEGLRNTAGIFTANIILKPETILYQNRNLYVHRDNADLWRKVFTNKGIDKNNSANGSSCGENTHSPAGVDSLMIHFSPANVHIGKDGRQYAGTIDIMSRMPIYHADGQNRPESDKSAALHDQSASVGLPNSEASATWLSRSEILGQCICLASNVLPGLDDAIDKVFTSMPSTWEHYTGTPGGSAYGIVKDWNDPLRTVLSVRTPLPNLLMTGQSLNLHGLLGVSMTSVLTCGSILGLTALANEILGVSTKSSL